MGMHIEFKIGAAMKRKAEQGN